MYFGPPTKENNAAWENICGEDGGRVGISDKRVLRHLPQSMKGGKEGEFIYGIGVCHQLHCLVGFTIGFFSYFILFNSSGERERERESADGRLAGVGV